MTYAERFKCDHEGCQSTDTVNYDYDEATSVNLCDEHAKAEGFCIGCMSYMAGIESYDFSSVPGWCIECVNSLRHEQDDFDEYEEWDDYEDDEDY